MWFIPANAIYTFILQSNNLFKSCSVRGMTVSFIIEACAYTQAKLC